MILKKPILFLKNIADNRVDLNFEQNYTEYDNNNFETYDEHYDDQYNELEYCDLDKISDENKQIPAYVSFIIFSFLMTFYILSQILRVTETVFTFLNPYTEFTNKFNYTKENDIY